MNPNSQPEIRKPANVEHNHLHYFQPVPDQDEYVLAWANHTVAVVDGYIYGLHVNRTREPVLFLKRNAEITVTARVRQVLEELREELLEIDEWFFRVTNAYLNPDVPEDHAPTDLPARDIIQAFLCGYQLAFHWANKYDECLFADGEELKRVVFAEIRKVFGGPTLAEAQFK